MEQEFKVDDKMVILSDDNMDYHRVVMLHSPLNYRDGKIIPDERNINVEWGNFRQDEKNGKIQAKEKLVIELLSKYRILTSAMVGQAFNGQSLSTGKVRKRIFAKLLEIGVVHRYSLVGEKYLNFYVLSEAGVKYAAKMNQVATSRFKHLASKNNIIHVKSGDLSNIGTILAQLALNQLEINYIRVLPNYKNMLQNKKTLDRIKILKLSNRNTVTFFCVRRDQRMDNLISWMNNRKNNTDEVVLLVEDSYHAISILNTIHDKVDYNKIIFVTDLMLIHPRNDICFLDIERYSDKKHGIRYTPYSELGGFKFEQ